MMAETRPMPRVRRLDINRCSADRLSMVAGLSIETARRIIAYRRRKQRLANIDEISNVRGITPEDLKSLQQTTTVHHRKASPAKSSTKRSSSQPPSGMKKARQNVFKPAASPPKSTESKRRRIIKPKTLRKGTQTIETVDLGRKKMKFATREMRKDKKLPVRANRKVGLRRQTPGRQRASGCPGKRQPTRTNIFESQTLHVSTLNKNKKSISPGSLLMCREAHRLKATEGLDYIASTGSPRPLLVLESQRDGTDQARAQINNCAVTVHLMKRAPLMSPMVTVNIPSSVLLTEAQETGCGVERAVSPGVSPPNPAHVISTSTPRVDVTVVSVPSTGDVQKEQTGNSTCQDLNNSNNKETDVNEGKATSESLPTNFTDDINTDLQAGYVAGSDTDHATDNNGDSNAIFGSLQTKPTAGKKDTASFVLHGRENIPAPKSDMMSTSTSTGGGKRRTRSRRKTAEKVKQWLVNSSSSNIESTPKFGQSLEDKRAVADDSFMSGVTLLPSTTPAQQKTKTLPTSRARCKRGLERELDTAVMESRPATGSKSSQTPPCMCRSCRRKRRASRRSETAEGGVKRLRTEAELSPDAHTQELSTAWCLLL